MFTTTAEALGRRSSADPWVVAVRDVALGTTALLSRTPEGEVPSGSSRTPRISDDGAVVAYHTTAADITGAPGTVLHDVVTGVASAVEISTTDGELVPLERGFLSGDGQTMLFDSDRDDLVAGDDNQTSDVFAVDLVSGVPVLVSSAADGTPANATSALVHQPGDRWAPRMISASGERAVFESIATDLAGAELGVVLSTPEVFVADVRTGAALVTARPDGSPGGQGYAVGVISPDGRSVAVGTEAPLLARCDHDGYKTFVVHVDQMRARCVVPQGSGHVLAIGSGTLVLSTSTPLVEEDTDRSSDVYRARLR